VLIVTGIGQQTDQAGQMTHARFQEDAAEIIAKGGCTDAQPVSDHSAVISGDDLERYVCFRFAEAKALAKEFLKGAFRMDRIERRRRTDEDGGHGCGLQADAQVASIEWQDMRGKFAPAFAGKPNG
jgi:hypothetical protein